MSFRALHVRPNHISYYSFDLVRDLGEAVYRYRQEFVLLYVLMILIDIV